MPTSKAWSSSFASGPASRSPRTGCRLFDAAHADDAEAGVHVGHLAGDAGRQVRAQEGRGIADVLDGDVAAQRRGGFEGGQHLAEVAHARGGERLDRPRSEERRGGKEGLSKMKSRGS